MTARTRCEFAWPVWHREKASCAANIQIGRKREAIVFLPAIGRKLCTTETNGAGPELFGCPSLTVSGTQNATRKTNQNESQESCLPRFLHASGVRPRKQRVLFLIYKKSSITLFRVTQNRDDDTKGNSAYSDDKQHRRRGIAKHVLTGSPCFGNCG